MKNNKGDAKQAGGQATKSKGTQVKSLSASASRPSDKDSHKSRVLKCLLYFELEEEAE